MRIDVKIPSVGESILEVTVGTILKPSGSYVVQDQEIVEIETDKLNQILYAPESGHITFSVSEGDKIKVGEVIASIETEEIPRPKEQEIPLLSLAPQKDISEKTVEFFDAKQDESDTSSGEKNDEIQVSQKENDISFLTQNEPTKSVNYTRNEKRVKISNLRKVIAKRLVDAQQTSAMLTTFNEVDMHEVMLIREKYKEPFLHRYGIKLGLTSFFVKACTEALQMHPLVNSYFDQDEHVFRNYIDIGIAISSEKGLMAPVIRNCEELSFYEIEKKIDDFTSRANTGQLSVDELRGGGFTITNGGIFGSLFSTPIINPPQSAILGLHTIQKRPIVKEDQILIRPIMYLALTYDHRVLDGKDAILFLLTIKNWIEDPQRMILEV